jgi:hypothetical protein
MRSCIHLFILIIQFFLIDVISSTDVKDILQKPFLRASNNILQAKANQISLDREDNVTNISAADKYLMDVSAGTSKAILNYPQDVLVDEHNNIFVSDYTGHVIRLISGKTGAISTYAGTGKASVSGDNGPANQAGLSNPMFMAFDSSYNIYFTDDGTYSIRKISRSDAIISEYVNMLTIDRVYPMGLTFDSANNLYISSPGSHHIYKHSISSNKLEVYTTFPTHIDGVKIGLFYGLAHGRNQWNSNLYVTDHTGNTIWSVSPGLSISRVAGNGKAGYAGDRGLATSAMLREPYDIAIDIEDNLYIVEQGNNVIRHVDLQTKLISSYAGTGRPGYHGDHKLATESSLNRPTGITTNAYGQVYISDSNNNLVRSIFLHHEHGSSPSPYDPYNQAFAGINCAATAMISFNLTCEGVQVTQYVDCSLTDDPVQVDLACGDQSSKVMVSCGDVKM